MHQIQEEIGIPKISTESLGTHHAQFSVGPLPTGYGMTLGNAFRRVLLSSVPGAAVTGIKIAGVTHEYSTIKGVQDSVLDITLNLKRLHIKKETTEPSVLKLKVSKEGTVTAKDIECPSDVEILNKDLYITTLTTKSAKLDMEIHVSKGVGYQPAKLHKNTEANLILVDAIFSPLIKVKYDVESTRVGKMTNLDKLNLEIETNGAISPEDAMKFTSNILKSYFNIFNEENIQIEPEFTTDFSTLLQKEQEEQSTEPSQENYTPIEILGLSPRTLNALINGGIGSIEQLTKCTASKLSNFRGFGKKALTEVSNALAPRDLSLADE